MLWLMTTPLAISSTGLTSLTQPPSLSYTGSPTLISTQQGYLTPATGGTITGVGTTSTTLASITLNVGVYLFMCQTNASVASVSGANLLLSLYIGSTYTGGSFVLTSTTTTSTALVVCGGVVSANSTVCAIKCQTSTGTVNVSASSIQSMRMG